MESDATPVDANIVSRVQSIMAGPLVDNFVGPNDFERARFPKQHQTANAHCGARTHPVLIADTGPRSHPDNANPTQLTTIDVAAACVDRELFRIPRYAGAGSRNGRAYHHWNPVNTFVSAIE
eukprot:6197933-Pleurochrysis_carterae.AAC.2